MSPSAANTVPPRAPFPSQPAKCRRRSQARRTGTSAGRVPIPSLPGRLRPCQERPQGWVVAVAAPTVPAAHLAGRNGSALPSTTSLRPDGGVGHPPSADRLEDGRPVGIVSIGDLAQKSGSFVGPVRHPRRPAAKLTSRVESVPGAPHGERCCPCIFLGFDGSSQRSSPGRRDCSRTSCGAPIGG